MVFFAHGAGHESSLQGLKKGGGDFFFENDDFRAISIVWELHNGQSKKCLSLSLSPSHLSVVIFGLTYPGNEHLWDNQEMNWSLWTDVSKSQTLGVEGTSTH